MDIDKIYFNEEGIIVIIIDFKGYQFLFFEVWDLIKGKKFVFYIVDINLFVICFFGDYIVFVVLVSVIVMMFRLYIFGSEEKKLVFFLYGDYVELSEFKGMMGFCDFNDDDDDKDDDDGDI